MSSELTVLVFVDQANMHGQATAVDRRLDLVRLARYLADPEEGRRLVDCLVYAPLPVVNSDGVHKYHDHLRHSGCQVISKRAKRLPDGRTKADLDMHLAMDALELAREIRPDVVVLSSGDGDFGALALRIRRLGIRVEVASSTQSLAGELRAACQGTIELDDFFATCEPLNENVEAIGSADILDPA